MNCELCEAAALKAFWKNQWFYAIDASTDEFPCFIRIVAVRHVAEMSDLTSEERRYLWTILETAEECMIDCVNPDKVNYAQFGNMVPHLHWHLIARWKDDPYFPESPWGKKQRDVIPALLEARSLKKTVFLKALINRLNQLPLPETLNSPSLRSLAK